MDKLSKMRKPKIKINTKIIRPNKVSSSKKKNIIDEFEITPLVKSLIGVIIPPKDYHYKKDYAEYLFKKYNGLK